MTPGREYSPRMAEALLRKCLPDGFVGEALLGDLHAEFCQRARSRARHRAAAWYWTQVVRLGLKYLFERATHRGSYDGPGGLPSRPPRSGSHSFGNWPRFGGSLCRRRSVAELHV